MSDVLRAADALAEQVQELLSVMAPIPWDLHEESVAALAAYRAARDAAPADEPARPFTPHEILAALRAARQPVSNPDRVTAALLDGYDTCLEQLARLVDFPWHERKADEQ